MATKRPATTELNHNNWDEETEPEDAGTFTKASDDILEKRIVKTAKRRLPPREGAVKSAFGTFTGFKAVPVTNSSPFSFLANVNPSSNAKVNANNGASKVPENGVTTANENTLKVQSSITTTSMAMATTAATTTATTTATTAAAAETAMTTATTSKLQPTAAMTMMTATMTTVTATSTATSTSTSTSSSSLSSSSSSSLTLSSSLSSSSTATTCKKSRIPEQKEENIFKKSSDYFAKLKGLNESVAQWIKTHVDANPFCILTPIFRDYEKYLKEIESKHGNESISTQSLTEHTQVPPTQEDVKGTLSAGKTADNSPFGGKNSKSHLRKPEWKSEDSIFGNVEISTKSIFGKTEQKFDGSQTIFGNADKVLDTQKSVFGSAETNAISKNIFGNVGVNIEKSPFSNKTVEPDNKSNNEESKSDMKGVSTASFSSLHTSATTFSFGQSCNTSSSASAGFSFGSAKPFLFGAQIVKPQDNEDKTENDVYDGDEPPKPDFKPVTEEGAIFEQRCKVFVKKDGCFSDRGIGKLFLKPTPNGKTQLIVRAETSLGQLLLNTLWTENILMKRMNKTTIMLVCLPMPDSQPPPTPVLLRVKTPDAADNLFETLKKHRK